MISLGDLIFVLVSLVILANNLGNNISVIIYAEKGLVPIYTAISGLVIAPAYLLSSYLGGIIVSRYNINLIFKIIVFIQFSYNIIK